MACIAPFATLWAPGDNVLPTYPWSDYTTFQLPVHEFIRDEIRAGSVPLWIPWLGNGTPLHAGQQAGIFYPGLSLPLLFAPANTALKFALLVHIALAFGGEYRLARLLGAQRAGATLGAATLTQSGYLINHLMAGHVGNVIGTSLIPWFLCAIILLLDAPGPVRAALVAATGAALVLGAHPQIAYYAALLAVAWTLGSLTAPRGSVSRGRQLAWATGAALLAVVVSAVQWVPTLELVRDGLGESLRGDKGFASMYAMTTLDWVRLIVPGIAGDPMSGKPVAGYAEFFHERVMYIGAVAPFFVVYTLTRLRVDRWQWGAAALIAIGLIMALGDATPWFRLASQIVPGWQMFRCPCRVFAVVTPLVGLLAARGLDAWLAHEPPGWRRRRWLLPATLWLAATLTLLPDTRAGQLTPLAAVAHAWSHARSELIEALLFLVATAAVLGAAAHLRQRSGRCWFSRWRWPTSATTTPRISFWPMSLRSTCLPSYCASIHPSASPRRRIIRASRWPS